MARVTTPINSLRKKALEPLPGAVCAQWVHCNKPTCRRCPHGPYYRRFWRVGGRLRSAYVRKRDVAAVQAACAEWRRLEREVAATRRQVEELYRVEFRELRAQLRELYKEYGWTG